VVFYAANGDELAPRLLRELEMPTRSIRIASPTLDDVFMAHTGLTIRDAEASESERMRSRRIARARMRR
jgi:ABC-2 type transport system ATP-binding protein